jgi:hypothetical protein
LSGYALGTVLINQVHVIIIIIVNIIAIIREHGGENKGSM